MRDVRFMLLVAGLAAMLAPGEKAQKAVSCKVMAERAGWAGAPTQPAATATGAAMQTLPVGRAVNLALAPMARMQFAPPPGRTFEAASFGGLARFRVAQPGVYRISAGTAAWIDVTANGRSIESSAHEHDRNCPGVRKMVDFPLEPGEHLLQVAGSPAAEMTVLLTPLP